MILIKFVLFGIVGIFTELVFSALKNAFVRRDWSLSGETSLWMVPVYGLIAFIYPFVHFKVSTFGIVFRGLAYMIVFFVIQLIVGWALSRFKMCPWSYKGKLSVANGLINLAYAPLWFIVGLLIEFIYPFVSQIASLI